MVHRALFLGFVGLVCAGSVIASEPVPKELGKPGSPTSPSTSECGYNDEAVVRKRNLDLFSNYFVRISRVLNFTMPFVEQFQKLKPLIENLTKANADLGLMSVHDEKYENQKIAVTRLLTQYKQEYDDLLTVIYIAYNKDELRNDMILCDYYFDRSMGSTDRPVSTSIE